MAEKFSLKDHLFNPETLGQLADEFAAGLPGFKADQFLDVCVPGLQGRELMDRMEWMADCLETQLDLSDFDALAHQLEAALPAPLDPDLRDDDFGHFRHAVFGILTVRHGMENPKRALQVLHAATMRFSMEYYIRPFVNAHPTLTLATLERWATDPNYHVRRLVSEGTRARLPWAKKIDLDPYVPLAFLDTLHTDPTRYVTRSVANHLNDIAKFDADAVLTRLDDWTAQDRQNEKELMWMRRHALRTLIKAGHAGAMAHLGYDPAPKVRGQVTVPGGTAKIGEALVFEVVLHGDGPENVILDYTLSLPAANGDHREKVFKFKDLEVTATSTLELKKTHKLKGDATTFTLYPGSAEIVITANGMALDRVGFTLLAEG